MAIVVPPYFNKLQSTQFDTDGDGQLDKHHRYDFYEEPIPP